MLIYTHGNKKSIEKYWGELGENDCGYSGLRILKLTVSHEGIIGIK